MKAIKAKLNETNPDRVDAFEKGASAFAKKIVANFKDFEFVRILNLQSYIVLTMCVLQYTGESMNPDGMVALLNYRVCTLPFALFVPKSYLDFVFSRMVSPVSLISRSITSCLTQPYASAYFTLWKDGVKEVKL